MNWYAFKAYNSQTRYGYGVPAEADAYCDYLNRGHEINHYAATLLSEDEVKALDLGGNNEEGMDLSDELEADAEARRSAG